MKAEYIDHMGTDLRVVNAARISFNKESFNLSDRDKGLINYLSDHNHWTPFAHCIVQMRETVPIFVARQRFKHTVGFVYNEVSRRYVDDPPEFFVPEKWFYRPPKEVKQGHGEEIVGSDLDFVKQMYYSTLTFASTDYDYLINEIKLAPEQARIFMPQSMYTSYYVTGSLAAWARATKLRLDDHAQYEIQQLAKQWDKIIEPLFPESWHALKVRVQDNVD